MSLCSRCFEKWSKWNRQRAKHQFVWIKQPILSGSGKLSSLCFKARANEARSHCFVRETWCEVSYLWPGAHSKPIRHEHQAVRLPMMPAFNHTHGKSTNIHFNRVFCGFYPHSVAYMYTIEQTYWAQTALSAVGSKVNVFFKVNQWSILFLYVCCLFFTTWH